MPSTSPIRPVAPTDAKGYPILLAPHNVEQASPLDVRMRQILADSDFPAISKDALDALKQVPDDDASIQKLANIVLRDYALTLKVLRTANSAYYRRSEQNIESAAHAMLLLGARTVRHLAGSLLVFDHYRKQSPGLKELMLLSLLTANHAREVAMHRRLPDPEETHLCGMFRNLGEVLVVGYLPNEYAHILSAMETKNRSEGTATFEVLGFRFEDLGEAMAKFWGMPESAIAAIRADGPQAVSEIGVITAFAHDLTYAVYRRELDDNRDGVADVLARYAKRLDLTREQVAAILRSALAETKEIFSSAKVTLDDLRLRRLHNAAQAQLGEMNPAPPAEASGEEAQERPVDVLALRVQLTAEVTRMVQPASGEEVSRVILMVLEAIYRGGPFDRVVFCVMSPDRSSLKARFGLGTAVEQLIERFSFELSPREGPIVLAVLRRQSVYVPLERDFTSQEIRFAQSLGASSFGVFPVMVGRRLVGCVYCDRPWNAKLPDRATLAYVRALCDGAAKGIEARQSRTQESSGLSGAASSPTKRPAPSYTAAYKSDAVMRMLKGEAPEVVGQALGIPASVLDTWRKDFLSGAMARLRSPDSPVG